MTQKKYNKCYRKPKRKQPIFSFVRQILKLFYKRPKLIQQGKDIAKPSIVICNHVATKGPIVYDLYLPIRTIKWGAGEMLGGYKMRFKYLRNVFYMQKRGWGKFKASFIAVFSAFFSKMFYTGLNVIPTSHDSKLFRTVTYSIDALNAGASILIFPENSDEGYKDVLTELHPGFVTLAECYYKKMKKDVPIYAAYYDNKNKVLSVDEPKFIQDFVKRGLNRAQIAEEFRKIINNLRQRIQLAVQPN